MKIITLVVLMISSISWSQDYGKDIKQILASFSTLKSYHIEAKVKVSGSESYAFTSSIKTCQYGSRVKADISEMLINKKYAISIDHEDKTIRVDKGDYTAKSRGKSDMGLDGLEQMINENASVEFLGQTEKYRTYVIYNNMSIAKTVIKIDRKTNFFYEMEVFYQSDEVSISSYKVTYTEFIKDPTYKRSDFDESTVFTEDKNGDLVPTEEFKDYVVIKQY